MPPRRNKTRRASPISAHDDLEAIRALHREDESRRQQAAQRDRASSEQDALWQRLGEAYVRAYDFPADCQGRQLSPSDFRAWAKRFLDLAALMREWVETEDGPSLAEWLRSHKERSASGLTQYACEVLLLAADAKAEAVAYALESAFRSENLCRHVDSLPAIIGEMSRDWWASDGPPDDTSREENQQAEQANPEAGPRIVLRGRHEGPIVLGKEKPMLTNAQYDVVKALLDAGDVGLTKDALDHKSGHGDGRRIMRRLANSDPDWKAVLHFPGKSGGGIPRRVNTHRPPHIPTFVHLCAHDCPPTRTVGYVRDMR